MQCLWNLSVLLGRRHACIQIWAFCLARNEACVTWYTDSSWITAWHSTTAEVPILVWTVGRERMHVSSSWEMVRDWLTWHMTIAEVLGSHSRSRHKMEGCLFLFSKFALEAVQRRYSSFLFVCRRENCARTWPPRLYLPVSWEVISCLDMTTWAVFASFLGIYYASWHHEVGYACTMTSESQCRQNPRWCILQGWGEWKHREFHDESEDRRWCASVFTCPFISCLHETSPDNLCACRLWKYMKAIFDLNACVCARGMGGLRRWSGAEFSSDDCCAHSKEKFSRSIIGLHSCVCV